VKHLKKVIWIIDQFLTSGRIQIIYSRKLKRTKYQSDLKKALGEIKSSSNRTITTFYDEMKIDELSDLCDLYGSDKGERKKEGHPYPWPSHTYADFYSRIFFQSKKNIKYVFECGIGTNNPALPSSMKANGKPGASLRVWTDYFPNAVIYGADIDRDILFTENRIKTYYLNQLDPKSIYDYFANINSIKFDLMIDDGLHTFEAGSTLFRFSIDKLSHDGIYVIEDVTVKDLFKYKIFFNKGEFVVDFVMMDYPDLELGDNNLVVIRKTK